MKNLLVNFIIFLLIFVGVVILGRPLFEEPLMAWLTHVEIVPEEFETNLVYAIEHSEFDIDAITAIGWAGLMPYIGEEVSPIGEVIIPTVNIHLPILHGATNANMSLGATTLAPDDRMGRGNFGLASHWMPQPGLLFASLHEVEIGDMIFLRDANYIYSYEVIENKVVDIYRGDVLDYVEGRTLVTLVTCTPDMLRRVIVQGELVQSMSIEDILSGNDVMDALIPTEILSPVVVTFPFIEVGFVGGGAFLLASLVVRVSSRDARKRKG